MRFSALASLAFLLLSGCASAPADREAPADPDAVETNENNLYGTSTTIAPGTDDFHNLPPQAVKLSFECEFLAPGDPDLAKWGQNECEEIAGRLLTEKKFAVVDKSLRPRESWRFRFEERRRHPGGGSLETFVIKENGTRMWGTLTRFRAGEERPFSHIAVSGTREFKRGSWAGPAGGNKKKDEPLTLVLLKSLLLKAVADPKAGAAEIESAK